MRFVCFLLLSISLFSAPASAGVLGDLASPWTTPARYVLIGGTALTLGILAFEDQTEDPAQAGAIKRRPLGAFNKFGDYGGRLIVNGAYVAGMFIAGLAGDKDGYHRAKVMTLASVYSCSVSTALKYIVREPRPDGSDRKSFPSGHTTAAFAFASVVGAEDGWGWGALSYAFATAVAVSRMSDNKHNLHDVIGGATIGTVYGLGVHYRHRKESALAVAPLWEPGVYGLLASYRF